MEKFVVLASDIDLLRQRLEELRDHQPVNDLTELIDLSSLEEQFGVSAPVLRRKFRAAGAPVIKLGRRYCIRKVQYLRALETLEQSEN